MKGALQNVLLVLLSAALTLAALEIALPLAIRVTDRIDYVAVAGVGLGLKPHQDGRFIREGIDARFHVNGSGFNNPHEYSRERLPGVARIAVVGDSFVEAFHVNPENALFSVLERGLGADGIQAEIYSFGISGFGTSQVFRLTMDTVLPYAPDLVVYLFIRNDLSDSSPCLDRSAWTQQYDLDEDGRLVPLPVGHYATRWWSDLLRDSRLCRYLLYQRRLLERIRAWGRPPDEAGPHADGACLERSWAIVEALLVEMQRRLEERGIPLLIVWQGDADPDYAADIRDGLERIARRRGLRLFDPSTAFREAAGGAGTFRIPGDGHWNAAGHGVVGRALVPAVEALLAERRAAPAPGSGAR